MLEIPVSEGQKSTKNAKIQKFQRGGMALPASRSYVGAENLSFALKWFESHVAIFA